LYVIREKILLDQPVDDPDVIFGRSVLAPGIDGGLGPLLEARRRPSQIGGRISHEQRFESRQLVRRWFVVAVLNYSCHSEPTAGIALLLQGCHLTNKADAWREIGVRSPRGDFRPNTHFCLFIFRLRHITTLTAYREELCPLRLDCLEVNLALGHEGVIDNLTHGAEVTTSRLNAEFFPI